MSPQPVIVRLPVRVNDRGNGFFHVIDARGALIAEFGQEPFHGSEAFATTVATMLNRALPRKTITIFPV